MRIRLLAAGTKPPTWVSDGYQEYARRMKGETTLDLLEIPILKRSHSSNLAQVRKKEGERMRAAIPAQAHVVALEVTGQHWSTPELANQIERWQMTASTVCLLIGGPDGLSMENLELADQKWSLSAMTFPHMLVRIMVAEQIYRAWSYTKGHPYHRE
jgi:23S rRNA (pseudouridine1915-N3)-methyltransferase